MQNRRFIYPDFVFNDENKIVEGRVVVLNADNSIDDVVFKNELAGSAIDNLEKLEGLLIPGLVNCHAHTELSWMGGLLNEYCGMNSFYSQMREIHSKSPKPEELDKIIENAILQMFKLGINVCADISNTANSFICKENSPIRFHTFVEILGVDPKKIDDILKNAKNILQQFRSSKVNTATLSLHTLFTVHHKLIEKFVSEYLQISDIQSLHYLESEEELNLFMRGIEIAGLENSKIIDKSYHREFDMLKEYFSQYVPILFVHNTFLKYTELRKILDYFREPWFCLCPNSNFYINKTLPAIEMLRENTENIVLGTDSLASNWHIDMFSEMRCIRKAFPNISDEELLKMSTINGARFLRVNDVYGSISKNKKPGLLQVKCYERNNSDLGFKNIERVV